MSASDLFAAPRLIERLDDCFFYHAMELPGFGLVPAHWDLRGRFDDYIGGVDVAGKSVLDVGTATGFLSFEAEKRGASRVVSFDQKDGAEQTFLPFKDKPYYSDHARWAEQYRGEIERWKNAYWLSHRLLGSKAEVCYGNVYDLPRELGEFDVTILGSVLEHLSDPISALASSARLTTGRIVVVTPLLETEEPIARFEGRVAHPEADFTWWIFSLGVYREVFGMLGFAIEKVSRAKYRYMFGDRDEERATLVAVREPS